MTEIAAAIRAAAAGRRWLSPQATEAIIHAKTAPPPTPDTELTTRELEIMTLMAKGLKNPQIAETIHISVSTVKFHIGVIFKKLGAQTRTEAVMIALEKGLVERPDNTTR
ncbi:MAG: response regulator transcription factor [Anaerolineae bacterium]|nr:response regulator transcription factor [Anaerolineae bacterium]